MNKCYNYAVSEILKTAEKEMLNLHHPYVGTEHLLLSLLKKNKVKKVCNKFNLTYDTFKKELIKIVGKASKKSENILYTPLLKLVVEKAYNKSYDEQKNMDEIYLLNSLINETDGIALRIVDSMGVEIKDITKEITKPVLANKLGINLNEKVSDENIYLREKELEEIMQILLRKSKNNPLLIGKAGVGKTAVVEELARRIKSGNVPHSLKDKEIILINTSTLIAGTKYRGEFEERVNNLIKEVVDNKNIILFIDEIHNIVKTGASDGSIDAANILKPYLARGELSLIGATTTHEYNEYIKKDAALTRRFATILIKEPNLKDMEHILMKVKKNYEKFYNLTITKKAILSLIDECEKYLPNKANPDKSLDVLDTICSKKTLENYKNIIENLIITDQDIKNYIAIKTNINILDNYKIEELKEELATKYNDQILKNIINIIKDKKLNKHMILYGADCKTKEKALNEIINRLNINLINIDCKEYNDEYSLNKLLASDYLYEQINENPYSAIIFNNYEAANKVLYNIINVMINNGYITNSKNEKILLNNTIIFLLDNTTNSQIGFNNNKHLLFAS